MYKMSTKNMIRLLKTRFLKEERMRHERAEQKERQRNLNAEKAMRDEIDRYLYPLGEVVLSPAGVSNYNSVAIRASFYVDSQVASQFNLQAPDTGYFWNYVSESLSRSLVQELKLIGLSGVVRANELAEDKTVLWPSRRTRMARQEGMIR